MRAVPNRLLIKNGTLIDGSGRDPVKNTLVIVEGNRITHIGAGDGSIRPQSANDTAIDAEGKFILPGLIDAHCHISLHQGALPGIKYASSAEFCTLWAAYAIGHVLRAGVTSIVVPAANGSLM
jgi:imidazolonepropionase-like amidohydrolase